MGKVKIARYSGFKRLVLQTCKKMVLYGDIDLYFRRENFILSRPIAENDVNRLICMTIIQLNLINNKLIKLLL